jgi:hypothetical protein
MLNHMAKEEVARICTSEEFEERAKCQHICYRYTEATIGHSCLPISEPLLWKQDNIEHCHESPDIKSFPEVGEKPVCEGVVQQTCSKRPLIQGPLAPTGPARCGLLPPHRNVQLYLHSACLARAFSSSKII